MISNLAIRRPVTTAMFFIAIGMLGVVSLGRLNVELMPEVVFPEIFIVANQSAMSPEQIEREVVMVGVDDRAEVWPVKAWEALEAEHDAVLEPLVLRSTRPGFNTRQ